MRRGSFILIIALVGALLSPYLGAEELPGSPPEYCTPPKEILELAEAPRTPLVLLSPGNRLMALLVIPPMVPISELAAPELKLAGLRFNPQTAEQTREYYIRKLALMRVGDEVEIPVKGIPEGARIRDLTWSPDSRYLAFTAALEGGVELWVVDTATAAAKRVTEWRLNCIHYNAPFAWQPDSRTLIVRALPKERGPAPVGSSVPTGPVVQETSGKKAPARTYQDLLKNPSDEDLFAYHISSQILVVSIDGTTAPVGSAGMIVRAEPSPDGRYLLVETLHRPFSYLVPEDRFARRVEVWDVEGKVVRMVADLPLAEEVPVDFDAVRTGPRDFGWRDDEPAELFWAEAQDKGDPKVQATVRDKLFTLAAPFNGSPIPLIDLGLRYEYIVWGDDSTALVSESWWKNRKTRTWKLRPAERQAAPQLVFDRSSEDRYSDPGYPMIRPNVWGRYVLRIVDRGSAIYLRGEGASPEGDRPFLDLLNLTTLKSKRLWRSEAPYYERVVDLLDDGAQRLIMRRESITDPPNYFIRDLRKKSLAALTQFPHPTPQLLNVEKELIRYKRADGVMLTGTLYLPPGWSPEKDPLPTLLWAYPQEFKSASAAGQVTDSPYRFVRMGWWSPLFWLVRGYAVLDDPSLPIVGEGDLEPNDTYVQQLVSGATAAIDELVRRGVTDPARVAIGGHSYGAFTTANLLAQSDLFRAGLARSGAYNRTLTPFGFQAEERTFWQAQKTYVDMSPFAYADKIDEPLLLIHGIDDDNSGTFPIQSERLYQAIKGLGGTARLVMLPLEAHGYRARESILHMLCEMDLWLEKYLKNAPPRPQTQADLLDSKSGDFGAVKHR